MNTRYTFMGILITLLTISTASSESLQLRIDTPADHPAIQILRHDPHQVEFEVKIPLIHLSKEEINGRLWDRIELPGGAWAQNPGSPDVPSFSRLLAIPATAAISVQFERLEHRTITDIDLAPAPGSDQEEIQFDEAVYARADFYPSSQVSSGDPALMRGLRVVPITMNPIRYNPVTKDLEITHRFKVTVSFEGTDLRNTPQRAIRPMSRSWLKTISGSVINLDELDLVDTPTRSYLIICVNDPGLVDILLPIFTDWKLRKGHEVVLETFSPGASTEYIKNIIQHAYDNWEIPPEYVLLWGDTSGDYYLPAYDSYGLDHPYTQLDGDDILSDVALGRCPAEDDFESLTMINKVLYYEKRPFIANDEWYHQSVLVSGTDNYTVSQIFTNQAIKARMLENEFTRIDTHWYWMAGSVPNVISTAINDGVSYFNYLGWLGMQGFDNTDIENLVNTYMLPFVSLVAEGTGGFAGYSTSRMETFLVVGTPTSPTGAIACVGGATSSQHGRYCNTLAGGLYAGIFDEGITQAGNVLVRGKLELYNALWEFDSGQVVNNCKWYALAGDPGVELFTRAIQYMECEIPDSMILGENVLSLSVNETGVGPLQDAIVCFYKQNQLQEVGLTDESGCITLSVNPLTAGNMKVTITKQNFYPIVDSLDIVQADVAVGYFSHTINDDDNGSSSGDDDGILNPGEQIEIPFAVKNYGATTSAIDIFVEASADDEFVSLVDSIEYFPDLYPNSLGYSYDDFDLVIAENCPHGHPVRLNLMTHSNQGSWEGVLDLEVVSYNMDVLSAAAVGADSLLSPGETADLVLTVLNEGGKDAETLSAVLGSADPLITIHDGNGSFGTVNVGDAATNNGNPFNLTASADAPPGHQAELTVTYTSVTGAIQTETFVLPLGSKSVSDPQGPDEYGYYCFDDTDLYYAQVPTFIWIEIDPEYGGAGAVLPIEDPGEDEDMSVDVRLPFTFRYYGADVHTITVCSNGWISTVPNASLADFCNYHIPSGMGPSGLIAPFWDDLITDTLSHVCAWYDEWNHRFIIQWSRLRSKWSQPIVQTFEIVLFDPAHHPTITGDGSILFQYHTIEEVQGNIASYSGDNGYSTIGIERSDKQDGIEVVYWNTYYDPAAAPVQDGRAYLFTTNFDYTPPAQNLQVILTPAVYPIVLPSTGGSFDFNIEIENTGTTPAMVDAWINVTLPDGTLFGPLLGPIELILPESSAIERDRTQHVPASAPEGIYVYRAYVGQYPLIEYHQDSFGFTKLPGNGSGNWDGGWENTGEPFFEPLKESEVEIPDSYALQAAYPNPFNPKTTIAYALPEAVPVNLSVYNVSGQLVVVLNDGMREAGIHEVAWNAPEIASGIYIYRIEAGDFTCIRKMILIK
jgi:hypothetical protein